MVSIADRMSSPLVATSHRAAYLGCTVSEAVAAVNDSGSHFFDPSTVRFFNSRLHGRVYAGRFFVESVRCSWSDATDHPYPREYRVVWFYRTEEGVLVHDFVGWFDTLKRAVSAAKRIAANTTFEDGGEF